MALGIYRYYYKSGVGALSLAEAVTTINSGAAFTISSTDPQTPTLLEIAKYDSGMLKKYTLAFTGTTGSYGSGGTAITSSQLEILNVQPFLETDFNHYSNFSVTDLGTLSSDDFVTALNASSHSATQYQTVYKYTYNTVAYYKLFVFTSGTTNPDFRPQNFYSITTSTTPPEVWGTASRRVAVSTSGSGVASGNWTKIASIDFGTLTANVDFTVTLLFQSTNTRLQSAIVAFSGRQRGDILTTEMLNAEILAMSAASTQTSQQMFTNAGFKIINNGYDTPFEIYVQKASTLGQFTVHEMGRYISVNNIDITYYSSQPWQSEPAGTVSDKSSGLSYKGESLSLDSGIINARAIGAGNGGDDTALLQNAINTFGAKRLFFPAGNYKVKELGIPENFEVCGVGEASVLEFYPGTDTNAVNAGKYAVSMDGAHSFIHDLKIDGKGYIGNGLHIKPDASGMQRSVCNLSVEDFTAYVEDPDGGNYGVGENYSREDLNGTNGSVLGGNAITCQSDSSFQSWELYMDNIRINRVDGTGFNFGKCTDSKLSNFWIGSCVNSAFVMENDNQNNQVSNLKVYRSCMLNVRDNFATSMNRIIPYRADYSNLKAAILLTGANNSFVNIEAQENGAHGITIGTQLYSLRHSTLTGILVDGNGGIDSTADAPTNAEYRRNGIFMYNFYNLVINGIAQDFRSKRNFTRQRYGLYCIGNKPEIASSGGVRQGGYYRIKSLGTSANFTAIMGSELTPKLNEVGTVFQAAWDDSAVPADYFNGGLLEAVNDNLTVTMGISDNWEQINGNGAGYDVSHAGTSSTIIINGNAIIGTQQAQLVNDADYGIRPHDPRIIYTALTTNRTVFLPRVRDAIKYKAYTVKDKSGSVATYNITVRPDVYDATYLNVKVDGSIYIIDTNYSKTDFYTDGLQWYTY